MSQAKRNKERCAEWTAQQIARSSRFTACMFVGHPNRYEKRWASSLEEARTLRAEMEKEYQRDPNRRPILIYAVTDGDNLSIHVE